jgi:hypothetical protein
MSAAIPPLQAGDHLTRDEFERRYRAMPHVHRAELIEGVVYMPSPVSASEPGEPHFDLNGWIIEIAASSASYDLHEKLHVYRRNGVQEHLVWRAWDRAIDWFILREGRFERLDSAEGIYRSQVFRGLWLDGAAAIRGDMPGVLEVLHLGLASPEHTEFVCERGN